MQGPIMSAREYHTTHQWPLVSGLPYDLAHSFWLVHVFTHSLVQALSEAHPWHGQAAFIRLMPARSACLYYELPQPIVCCTCKHFALVLMPPPGMVCSPTHHLASVAEGIVCVECTDWLQFRGLATCCECCACLYNGIIQGQSSHITCKHKGQ